MIGRIRAILYALVFMISVSVLIVYMMFAKKNRKARQLWGKIQRLAVGFKIDKKGEFDSEAKLLMINHQSMLDIIVLEEIYPGDLCWIAKKELNKTPFIDNCIKYAKMITIDRNNPREIVKIIKESKEKLAQDRIIAIFPEGTRGRGTNLLKFQSGAKIIAEKLDLKVQPIIITNTRNIMDTKKFTINSGKVGVIILDAINPKTDPNWYEKARESMKKALEQEINSPL